MSGSYTPAKWAAGDSRSMSPPPSEEGEVRDGDSGDESTASTSALPWVVDTQPRKPHKKRRKAKESESAAQTPQDDSKSPAGSPVPEDQSHSLLLPDHVGVQDATKRPDTAASDADDDYDSDVQGHLGDFTQIDADTSGVTRYYQAAEAEERKQFKECEICGEKGHTKRDCSHLLCASCGAMDEHTTRDCPVGVSCFRCGQRGHRRNECKADIRRMHRSRDCRRCGSLNHSEQTCPTYWRIYVYVDEEDWQDFRAGKARDMEREREEQGGRISSSSSSSTKRRKRNDGTSSSDMDTDDDQDAYKLPTHREDWDPATRWCYNCTAQGTHWGDDCPLPRRAHGRNGEPSIFSEFISTSGPFAYRLAPANPANDFRPGPSASGVGAGGPTDDMYDVSVGPDASMHFLGGRASRGSGVPSIEEEVDRIFARAPRAQRGRAERDRPRERERPRERDRERGHPSSGIQIKGQARGTSSSGNTKTNGDVVNGNSMIESKNGRGKSTTTNSSSSSSSSSNKNGDRHNGRSDTKQPLSHAEQLRKDAKKAKRRARREAERRQEEEEETSRRRRDHRRRGGDDYERSSSSRHAAYHAPPPPPKASNKKTTGASRKENQRAKKRASGARAKATGPMYHGGYD